MAQGCLRLNPYLLGHPSAGIFPGECSVQSSSACNPPLLLDYPSERRYDDGRGWALLPAAVVTKRPPSRRFRFRTSLRSWRTKCGVGLRLQRSVEVPHCVAKCWQRLSPRVPQL